MIDMMERFTSMMSPVVVKVVRNVEVSAPVKGMPLQKSLIGITAMAPMPTIGNSTIPDEMTPRKNALYILSKP
jgi:hypothetical protein